MTSTHPGLRPYGFEGPVDYIERITYLIWNRPNRDLELIRRHYSPSTAIHLDAGDLVGDEIVIANTTARLQSYPDFHGVIDDTIWTGSEEEGYRTSMRWTWTGTDTGGTVYGPATGRPVTSTAIANCVVKGETIVEEWLGVNPLALARQLGYPPADAVRATDYPATPRVARPSFEFTRTAEGDLVQRAFAAALEGRAEMGLFASECATAFAPDIQVDGVAALLDWADGLRAALGPLAIEVDDQYSMPASEAMPVRVATQWRITGTGPRGPVEFSLLSHHHLGEGRITAQWLAYDELALAHHGIASPHHPKA
ncbi:ester cyclase [Paenarthrobacter sp. OM7]|uniref:ester cyclase n=1 Tax=Paenarthrobacter sp. OM7 TaxID=3041264 RepID=UPI0024685735|nr:ester cyclase [Paenarthrobacter sp. OM7]WGM20483.1 ester cyclase [Paenarthrobacter sp. OM7]